MKSDKNKKIIIIIAIIILLFIIFGFFYYNFVKRGNTSISKSQEQIVQDILNTSKYTATMQIEVISNKNKNKYVIKQEVTPEISTQEVLEPSNIAGIITKYENNTLTIENTKLNLSKIYEEYQYLTDNQLWLNSFIKDYKENNGKVNQNENLNEQIIMTVKNSKNNKYNQEKNLYIDLKTGKPTKLTIEDINQNILVYILYTEIQISY